MKRKLPPDMTHSAAIFFDNIMVTLGKKTKIQFVDELRKEMDSTYSANHQMLNYADVGRVALKMNIEI